MNLHYLYVYVNVLSKIIKFWLEGDSRFFSIYHLMVVHVKS